MVPNMPEMIRVRAVVYGRVQGVGFRYSASSMARMLNVVGWVRNLPSGEVEVEAQGAPRVVDDFVAWLRMGPRSAVVTDVQVTEVVVDPAVGAFMIR